MMVAIMPNKSLIALFVAAIFIVSVCEAKLSQQEKLNLLRNEMTAKNYHAVIIPSDDEHLSEYPPSHELRREWISGFTGSAGTAVVTANKAALWTDSRYWDQAADELDSSLWTLMKQGADGVSSLNSWITEELKAGDKVGMSAKFVSIGDWESREKAFKAKDIILENTDPDLIDLIWPDSEREPKPTSEIKVHALNFAGKTWEEKVAIVQERMVEEGADLLIVSALDEVAWLLNLRAKDIPYNPMVISYAIISRPGSEHHFYIDESRIDQPLRDHLKGFVFKSYSSVIADITELSQEGKRIWVPTESSYAIYQAVANKDNIVMKTSPVQLIKARKSQVEIENTRRCHIRDSAARVRHLSWLDTQIEQNREQSEKTSARMLESIQAEDANFVMPSFEPISAVGPNAAIVHYSTDTGGKNLTLSRDKIYLLDAGAQYLDCTTDITRTHHFGRPTQKERYAYTRVMQGSIDLANIVFPSGVYGRELDVQARQWLWRSGLDFGHGTGHGIGYYLSVHEYPPGISVGSGGSDGEFLDKGMVESDEPGYYETGSFGIRLETDLEVVEANVPNHFRDKTYFKFEPLTFVPFDRNLIDECVLTNSQVDWLNKYNKQIQEKVRPLLKTEAERGYLDLITQDFKYTYTLPYCSRYSPNSDDQGNSAQTIVLSKPLMAVLSILYIAYTRL